MAEPAWMKPWVIQTNGKQTRIKGPGVILEVVAWEPDKGRRVAQEIIDTLNAAAEGRFPVGE